MPFEILIQKCIKLILNKNAKSFKSSDPVKSSKLRHIKLICLEENKCVLKYLIAIMQMYCETLDFIIISS